MTRRISYDDVEKEAIRWRREGYDIKLKLKADGRLIVYHDDKEVLVDPGRSYMVAHAKVRSIGMLGRASMAPDKKVVDKDVQKGAKSTKARAKKRASKAKKQ